jgi:hypothetical protein
VPWGDAVLQSLGSQLGLQPLAQALACRDQATVRQRFVSYSACILSFVGAVHWGAAMAAPTALAPLQFSLSMAPALLGWAALNVGRSPVDGAQRGNSPHALLAGGYLLVFFMDELATAAKPVAAVPPWLTFLRTPLTTIVLITHCLASYNGRQPSISDLAWD